MLRSARRRPEAFLDDFTDDERRWVEESAASGAPSAEDAAIAADLAEKLLGTLSGDDRLAVMLVEGEGMSVRDAAAATGWSEAKVKTQAHRARRRLREAWERLIERSGGRG